MRGEVEVWSGDKLILKEANMLTDGAGELLADIMTVSPSLATVDDSSTQAILDASNYTIQAISFGTASEAFTSQGFGRGLEVGKAEFLSGAPGYGIFSIGGWNTVAAATRPDAENTNKYYPTNSLFPIPPSPTLKQLELETNISSVPGEFFDDDLIPVSSLFPGNGQHVNFMPSSIREAVTQGTPLSGSFNSFFVGTLMGSYPAGISERGVQIPPTVGRLYYRKEGEDPSPFSLSLVDGSYPNEASSMDVSGFITSVTGTDTTLGLTTSSNASFASNGTLEYSTTLSKDDVASLHLFGGIYHLGLWTIDMQESLCNGNTPPFAFSVLDNPRKYKLFCRKGVAKDLTFIEDVEQYADLTIKWRLHFL